MKQSLLLEIITFFFACLFLYAGVTKLLEISSLKNTIAYYPLLGAVPGFVAFVLPIGELLLAVVLVVPKLRMPGLYITFILMSIFTGYVSALLLTDSQISCSCGGVIKQLTPKQHIIFNSACVFLSAIAIMAGIKEQSTIQFKNAIAASAMILFLVLGWALFTAISAPIKIKSGMEGKLLPSFDLLLPDSANHFNTANIKPGKAFIIIGFSPYCQHCQEEIRDIVTHIQKFKETHIYLITPFPYSAMKQIYILYNLEKYPNITTALDYKNTFLPYFKANKIPYNAVFDESKRLEKVIMGRANISDLSWIKAK